MNRDILIKNGFKEYRNHYRQNDWETSYQKNIIDKRGIKYFINCYEINHKNHKCFTFKAQFSLIKGNYFNVECVQWFNCDDDGSYRGDNNIEDVYDLFELMFHKMGCDYYELYGKEE